MKHRGNHDRGAALIEFALIMPLLILLILGIVEFGYKFGQYLEIRHAALEGARYAAVSNPDRDGSGTVDNNDVLNVVCSDINLPGATSITVTTDLLGNPGNRLDDAKITVSAGLESLSGLPLIDALVPKTLASSAVFRLEQDAKWTAFTADCP